MRAVADLLAERGLAFSLVDVADRAGKSVATSYRHLISREAAVEMFHHDLWAEWTERQERSIAGKSPDKQLAAVCRAWVRFWLEWGAAALVIRPTRGVLERHHEGDRDIERIWAVLAPIVEGLIATGEIPQQSVEYAVLLWITLLNERVILDLHHAGWSVARISESLSSSLMAVLRSPPATAAQRGRKAR